MLNLEPIVVRPVREEPPPYEEPPQSPPLIHPLSAVVLLAVDNLWMLPEFVALLWVVTIPLSFLTTAGLTYIVQRSINNDPPQKALSIALTLGLVAAIPTSIMGTPIGIGILAWSGLRKLGR